MKEFAKLDGYGQLYIDRVLFESYFPVIFTCKNKNNEIFICVCCQNNEKGCKWLIGKTNGISIVKMLQDKITVRQLLLDHSSGRISVSYVNGEYMPVYDSPDWNESSVYLPDDDSYMCAEDEEFADDILYFSSLNDICYDAEYYKYVAEMPGITDKGIELMSEALPIFVSVSGNTTIPSELIRTSKVSGEVHTSLMNIEDYMEPDRYRSEFQGTFLASAEELQIKVRIDDDSYADAA